MVIAGFCLSFTTDSFAVFRVHHGIRFVHQNGFVHLETKAKVQVPIAIDFYNARRTTIAAGLPSFEHVVRSASVGACHFSRQWI